MHYPKIMQPTHAQWEQVPRGDMQPPTTDGHQLPNGTSPNGTSTDEDTTTESMFPPISSFQYRNLVTADSFMRGPPVSGLGVPGPDANDVNIEPPGLLDVAEEVINELPEDCLTAFLAAREQERKWKTSWGVEKDDGARSVPKITYAQVV